MWRDSFTYYFTYHERNAVLPYYFLFTERVRRAVPMCVYSLHTSVSDTFYVMITMMMIMVNAE